MKSIIAIFLLGFVGSSFGFFGFTKKFNTHDEPFIPYTSRVLGVRPAAVEEKWIEQRLDNFDPQNNRRWQMRYLELNENFQPGGPIFIYVGGEWSISGGSISTGSHIYDMARELNGTLFYTEHRYYGQSHPTEDTSTSNLRFLTVDQALADLAVFITHIKASSPDLENSGVIMVGGSYSATMVAWMRKKYPHLVSGAWASSAPLNAQVDFEEYKDIMTYGIQRIGGTNCSATFENAFRRMEELVDAGDVNAIQVAFNLCSPLNLTTMDIPHFFYELSDIVAGLVQSHRSGSIEGACAYMANQKSVNAKDDMNAFAAWVNRGSNTCLDMSYQNSVQKFSNSDWTAEANRQMRQWTYQTCTEFAWFQTSSSNNQIFGSSTRYPVEYFESLCQDIYDFPFDLNKIEQNIQRTNARYGGFNLHVTNVYFTHGEIDPWHPMGILQDLNELSPVTILPLSAHVSDLGRISVNDSNELRASKQRVSELVREWLNRRN